MSKPPTRLIVLPAFLIYLAYLVMDGSISRYGVLTVPLGAILLVELLNPKVLLKDPSNELVKAPKVKDLPKTKYFIGTRGNQIVECPNDFANSNYSCGARAPLELIAQSSIGSGITIVCHQVRPPHGDVCFLPFFCYWLTS